MPPPAKPLSRARNTVPGRQPWRASRFCRGWRLKPRSPMTLRGGRRRWSRRQPAANGSRPCDPRRLRNTRRPLAQAGRRRQRAANGSRPCGPRRLVVARGVAWRRWRPVLAEHRRHPPMGHALLGSLADANLTAPPNLDLRTEVTLLGDHSCPLSRTRQIARLPGCARPSTDDTESARDHRRAATSSDAHRRTPPGSNQRSPHGAAGPVEGEDECSTGPSSQAAASSPHSREWAVATPTSSGW